MRFILLFVWCTCFAWITANEVAVPKWVLHGILGVESSSFYSPAGDIVYINRKRGRAGEMGPFQMTPRVFAETSGAGDVFEDLSKDTAFAEGIFVRRMKDLYASLGSWDSAVRAYNVGIRGSRMGKGYDYLQDVKMWAARIQKDAGGLKVAPRTNGR